MTPWCLQTTCAVTTQVHRIATAAEEQTATTDEISSNIRSINEVVRGLREVHKSRPPRPSSSPSWPKSSSSWSGSSGWNKHWNRGCHWQEGFIILLSATRRPGGGALFL